MDPELIVADEPLAALDVSIQAQVLNLLRDLQRQRDLTFVFISHDLAVVEHFATRVAVIYRGVLCELATTEQLFSQPRHPYTRALLSAVPQLRDGAKPQLALRQGIDTPVGPVVGCPFAHRCPYVEPRCESRKPELIATASGAQVACHAVADQRI